MPTQSSGSASRRSMAASMPLATSPLTALRASGRLRVITATRPCVSYWTMSVMRPMVGASIGGVRTDEPLAARGYDASDVSVTTSSAIGVASTAGSTGGSDGVSATVSATGSATTSVAGGSTTTSVAGGSTTTSVAGGSTTTSVAGGSATTSVAGGS